MPTATATSADSITSIDQAAVADAVRTAYEASQAIYPLGGGTAQDFGTAPTQSGRTLDLTGLNRIVDFTPRDMTIVVEAGVRMADLGATLGAERQHLPIDVPRAAEATIGGTVATNWSGPRRYGHGTIRDYIIGINAVDGRGTPFKGGGRVVKNVAGYDFCKLLTGSLGTLAVITQLALKVKPQPECSATVIGDCADLTSADEALSRLATLETPATAIDLLIGASWHPALQSSIPNPQSAIRNRIVVHLEGTEQEIAWLIERVARELTSAGGSSVRTLSKIEADELWSRQIEFSDRGAGPTDDDSPIVTKIALPASDVTRMINNLLAIDAAITIQAHAGSGIILARFSEFRQNDLTSALVGKLRPAAVNRCD